MRPGQPGGETEPRVDIARFGRVVTLDPNRNDGARASRIEEFRADDLFLESDVPVQQDGTYRFREMGTSRERLFAITWRCWGGRPRMGKRKS